MNEEDHWLYRIVWFSKRYCSFLRPDGALKGTAKSFFDKEYLDTLQFCGFHLSAYEMLLASYTIAFLSFLVLLSIDVAIIILYVSMALPLDGLTLFLMICITLIVPFLLMNLVASYPKTYLKYAKIHSLGDIPEVLSYLVMYLKLVPNLENSVKFAAMESSTSLVHDLRKMLWDMEIRVYHGITDALTQFANQWGRWSDHFKRSLHLIRSSIDEPEEAQRVMTLNKALDVGLEGTRTVMNEFAQRLHQPTLVIYSIGIMIPLAIIAMLPAAGLIGMQITIFQVFFLYDIILPLVLFIYIRRILLSRPATFNPPKIPRNHPLLKDINRKVHRTIALLLFILCMTPWLLILVLPRSSMLYTFLSSVHSIIPLSICLPWGIAVSIAYYTTVVFTPHKKIRDTIKHMEKEFSDALYIIGNRISEEKSPEESFLYTAETMKGSSIAELFSHTSYNLTALHTTISDALFNNEYGSLKHVYSERIRAIMRLFVEGIKKSQRSVSISIIRLADHLKELQEVETRIKENLSLLSSTLRSTAMIFAPMIAGVTLAITQLISNIIQKTTQSLDISTLSDSSVMYGITNSFSLENIDPTYFVLVIGVYIIELVFLLTRFTNGIDEGDDTAEFSFQLGRSLPVAVMVLTVSIILSQMFLSSIATRI
ncbi:MAG: hypothetical protein QCH96_02080 [Candidatus Thermoplasmatota archaeon]|nr:hypothetical protein [Candidatus Thermoplasmatota archaeon]